MPGTTDIQLHWVQTLEEANAFMRWLGERRPVLAVDTETAGFDWWVDPLRTVQFGDRHTGWCIEWGLWAGLVNEALSKYDGPIVMHNAKFDTHFLEVNGAPLRRWQVHDSRAMAHILDPASPSALKVRAARVLGPWAGHGEAELKEAMVKGGWGWGSIPVDLLWKYAAFDTVLTAQLAEELWPQVQAGWLPIYELELASTQVLADMERRGILTDRGYLDRSYEDWGRTVKGLEHTIRERFGLGNPNSDQQIVHYLRGQGWQPVVFTDKGNVKLDSDVLGGLAEAGVELAAEVLRLREFKKLRDTYCKNLIELAGPDRRLHPSINPLGARTGRMSVTRPALQTLPAKDARIRDAFVAGDGQTLITADYDQIEMRVFAHFSESRSMIEAIRYGDAMTEAGYDGYDLHSMNARMTFGLPMDQPVPAKLRKRVKGVGFGKVYGAGVETFAATSGLSLAEARQVISTFEQVFPETRSDTGFPSKVAEALWRRQRETGDPHVVTAYGRKEPCWPREAYKGVNYLIQGTAADVLKDRLVAMSRTWLGQHMLLPIHDEVIFEVPDEAVEEALQTIRQVMPERERFAVPLTVDAEAVKRWGDKKDYVKQPGDPRLLAA